MAKPGVRFIRVNGRIVPIKDKSPSAAQMKKNYDKHGDGANQAARIDSKYEMKSQKGTGAYVVPSLAGIAGVGAGVMLKNKFLAGAGLGLALGSGIAANIKIKKNAKRLEKARQREYVRTFGMDSEGNKPSRSKTGLK